MEPLLSQTWQIASSVFCPNTHLHTSSASHLGSAQPRRSTSSRGTEPRACPAALSTIQSLCSRASKPPSTALLLGQRRRFQAASHSAVIITLMCSKSAWCNKLRQASVVTLQAANSFIVTVRRCEFSFLGRAEAVKVEERTKGYLNVVC